MLLQYIELHREGKRIYQGVTFGEEDANRQLKFIERNAHESGMELRFIDANSWSITSTDGDDVWGTVSLRPF